MLTSWEYSIETEAKRLIQCAHQIGVGFYKTNNFIVLPSLPLIKNVQFVVFPELKYCQIPRFWEQVRKVDITKYPMDIKAKLVDDLKVLLMENSALKPDFETTKFLWNRAEDEILSEIYKIIPSKKDLIKKITIHPTLWGTGLSFNYIDNGEIDINLREDRGIGTIVEGIITSITREDIYNKLGGMWAESEMVTDYLITETGIADVLVRYDDDKSYLPTIKGIRSKEHLKLIQESEKYYNRLGIQTFNKPFSCRELVPMIFDKSISNLTETEKELLVLLIKNENQIVDFDEIGEAIFKTDDDFSLYAISKTIQRLRDKLESNGISGSYIQTLRGKGYMLKN